MDDDTLYKIAYWEIPGKHRSPDTFFRFCLGATAAIYMFDGNWIIQINSIKEIDIWKDRTLDNWKWENWDPC